MSFFNSMFRLNGVFVGLAFLLTEVLYGFVSGEETGSEPGRAAEFLFIYFPLVMVLSGVILSFLFVRYLKKDEAEL